MDEVENFGLQCAIVSLAPNILFIAMDIGFTGWADFSDGTRSVDHLAAIVGPSGHILINPWWYMLDHGTWTDRLAKIARLAQAPNMPGFHFLCNAQAEVDYVQSFGIDAILMNHNTFSNEKVFSPVQTPKIFDAIYNGKMAAFKRHELASKVENFALIYSRHGFPEDYFAKVCKILPNAKYLNGDPNTDAYKSFQPDEVAAILGSAQVGLCLSNLEGAMYSSMEYLLCGLSVVSTRSLGGRDLFFDERYCRIVEDDPAKVAAAVKALVEENIPPAFVRAETLKKIHASRAAFVTFVDRLAAPQQNRSIGADALVSMMSGPWACWSFMTIGQLRRHFV